MLDPWSCPPEIRPAPSAASSPASSGPAGCTRTRVLSFMDIHPASRGDLLVIPKIHAAGLEDIDEVLTAHLFRVVHLLARALRRSGLPCEGVNLFLADGQAAGQTVSHLHVHVFPRTADDRFHLEVRWQERSRAALDDDAAQVRAALERSGDHPGWL